MSSRVVLIEGQRSQVEIIPDTDNLPEFFDSSVTPNHIESFEGFYNVLYRPLLEKESPVPVLSVTDGSDAKFSISKVEFVWSSNMTIFTPVVDEREVPIQIIDNNAKGYLVQHCGSEIYVNVRTHLEDKFARQLPPKQSSSSTNAVLSPMPGTVLSVSVKVGDKVHEGQELLVLEAMKMQNLIVSPHDGVIKKSYCNKRK